MKIAIVIAVSEYTNLAELRACKSDASMMKAILEGSDEYDDIHVFDTDTNCTTVTSKLADIVREKENKKLDELFFYFTGHGGLHTDEFHFLFSDYDDAKHRQTSLSNEDLDDMLRKLEAKRVVKVIDACHSGVFYVKDSSKDSTRAVEKSISKSKNRLQNCYFMFSSEQEQSSWQDDKYSYFTLAFAKSIAEHTEDVIRYQQIAAYVADAFDGEIQTPRFVYQADFLDVFCTITEALRDKVTSLLPVKPATTTATTTPSSMSDDENEQAETEITLLDAVKGESERYCSEDEAREVFQKMEAYLGDYQPEELLTELFDSVVELHEDKHSGIPNRSSIARWLDKEDHELFVRVKYSDEEYEAEEAIPSRFRGHSSLFDIMGNRPIPTRTVTKTRRAPTNFEVSSSMPFYYVVISFGSKFPNIQGWKVFVLTFVSKHQVLFFHTLLQMKPVDWTQEVPSSDVKWTYQFTDLKPMENSMNDLKAILHDKEDRIVAYLQKRFGTSKGC